MASEMAFGPCDWPVSYASCTDLQEYANEDGRAVDISLFEGMATALLWEWTGRRFGPCEVTVRPTRRRCARPSTYSGTQRAGWQPVQVNGRWFNLTCGSCLSEACKCDAPAALILPGPVASVTSVVVDGVPLLPTAYRVDNRRFLVRLDGKGWPTSQDVTAAPGLPGTWSVTYRRGLEVPDGGQVAAGVLALELAKAACSDRDCALPQRIQTVTRQGVSMTILDEFEDVKEGRTGIWLIDSWVASIRGPERGGRVYSPDVPRRPAYGRTTSA